LTRRRPAHVRPPRPPPHGAAAWCGVAALLAAGALLVQFSRAGPAAVLAIDWQPGLAFSQPWRAWSAVWVHYSELHLGANLAGTVLVAALGWAAVLPRRAALAWLAAWPLTQLGLLVQPALAHYGGLSGVLHAGVAIAAVQLMREGVRRRRVLGVAILSGLALKVLLEAPWAGPLAHPPGWDIATAPLAHASGLVAGLIACLLLLPAPLKRIPPR
jgi:rhomboid family GlyGly-CTERM serine protease